MNIGIYIYDQAEVLDFSGPFEVFSTAARVAGENNSPFKVFLVGETGASVDARGGYRVTPHYGFDDHPPIDVLVVPGGMHTQELSKPKVIDWIAETARHASITASVCTGAFLLAQAKVVTTQAVTTHWEDLDDLRAGYPQLTVQANKRWVDTGPVVTSGGISAGIDMCLHLVSRLHGPALAQKTARQMEYRWKGDLRDTQSA